MIRSLAVVCTLAAALLALDSARAADPLKARYFTGGGWHDYKALAPVVTEGIGKHANVEWDIRFGVDELSNKDLAEGADVLVYNLCFDEADPAVIARLLDITRSGKPTVLVHCAMHSFKVSEGWRECCGQRTQRHDAYRGFSTTKADAEHPILKKFPNQWQTPGDELYQTIQLSEDSHPLLVAQGEGNRESCVCWFHMYGKGRVFATTLGHDMKTAAQDDYHQLLASGLLWACDKLGDDGEPKSGYAAQKSN